MRRHYSEKPTKKPHQNKNHPTSHNLLQDPFLQSEHQHEYQHEKQNHTYEYYQSQQTDIDLDDQPTQHIQWNKTIQKDIEIDTDLFANNQGRFQRRQVIEVRREISSYVDSDTSHKDNINMGLRKETGHNTEREGKRIKLYQLRPETTQKHINQIQTKILNSNYPQNVIKTVHPISYHNTTNYPQNVIKTVHPISYHNTTNYPQNIIKTVHPIPYHHTKQNELDLNHKESQWQQQLSQKQLNAQEERPGTKKTDKRTIINNSSVHCRQRTIINNSSVLSRQRENHKLIRAPKPLCQKLPKSAYETVQWSSQQTISIQQNLTWIGRVVARDQIAQKYSQKCVNPPNVNNVLQQLQRTKKNILQLKCMLRYRSVAQIIYEVKHILQQYQQHDEYLIDLNSLFKDTVENSRKYFNLNKLSSQEFHQKVIQAYYKILVLFVLEYPHCSQENRQLVRQIYQNQGFSVHTIRVKNGDILTVERTSDQSTNDNHQKLFDQQGLFDPYKQKVLGIKPKKLRVSIEQSQSNIENILRESFSRNNRHHEQHNNDTKELKIQKDNQQDVQIDGNLQKQDFQISNNKWEQDVQIDKNNSKSDVQIYGNKDIEIDGNKDIEIDGNTYEWQNYNDQDVEI